MKKLVLVAMASLAMILIGGTRGESDAAGPMNILFVTVDTLRADRLSCYGYDKKTSPNIDAFSKKGTLFEDAMTNVPLTNPSFSSLFTSRYPHQIGSIRNGIPMVEGVPTIATILKAKGFETSAVISNWPLKRHLSNLQQGWDSFDDDFHEKRWLFFNAERDAETVSDLALEWIEKGPKPPFLAWIHYSDPHAPYQYHDDFDFGGKLSDSERYDSEVGYTDHHVGRFLDAFAKSKLASNTLVIFTSDHGESLGEHGYTGHGRKVYQPSMRVPLIVAGPGVPAGARTPAPVQLLDLTPTALAFAGAAADPKMLGRDLSPALRGEASYPVDVLFYETYPGAAPQVEGAEKMLTKPIWVGYKKADLKIMFSVRFQRWEKYNLTADPGEEKDLVDLRGEEFIKESEKLDDWYSEWEDKTVVGSIGAMTEEDRAKFEALGYIDGQ